MTRVVYGRRPVIELLRSVKNGARTAEQAEQILISSRAEDAAHDRALKDIIYLARATGIPLKKVPEERLNTLAGGERHQGVVVLIREGPKYADVDEIVEVAKERGEPSFLVVLDQVQDPRNLGAVLRTAEVAGVHGVIIPKRRAAGLTDAVAKTAAGAEEHVKVARVTNIAQTLRRLKEKGLWVYGTEAGADRTFWEADLTTPLVLVLGNEEKGLSDVVKKECDFVISIPIRGKVESLNVSVAAGIVIYEVIRQRLWGRVGGGSANATL
ncbi:MAG TPA: 23S rRNA (guanosine(2251)-2'-O)-methyltransferase RlmB [Clostridia bacterium]|nr:23S rRNA (guanosine(2251)-2'-O)-methyltransferase RlmB [Clostridia bacterium]